MELIDISNNEFEMAMGTEEVSYIDEGRIKTINNGMFMHWSMYLSDERKIFIKFKDENNIFYKNSEDFNKTLVKSEKSDEVIEILGYKCKKVTIIFDDDSSIVSYFAPKLNVNSEGFKYFNVSSI